MNYHYPTLRDLGLKIPSSLYEDRFNSGFLHALKGGRLDEMEYFRLSFRMGYRAAKIYLREVRRERGIIDFPLRVKFKIKLTNR